MARYEVERRAPLASVRDLALEDVRKLARTNMRHRDLAGLAGLMDDYLALADELEVVSLSGASVECVHANDHEAAPSATVSGVADVAVEPIGHRPEPRAA